jgi:hypothetical protein
MIFLVNGKPLYKRNPFFQMGFYTKYTKIKLYLNLSTDFTSSSSFLIALLDNKINPKEISGMNNPIPFTEIETSPGKLCK